MKRYYRRLPLFLRGKLRKRVWAMLILTLLYILLLTHLITDTSLQFDYVILNYDWEPGNLTNESISENYAFPMTVQPRIYNGSHIRGWIVIRQRINITINRTSSQSYSNKRNSSLFSETIPGRLTVYSWWGSCYTSIPSFRSMYGFPNNPHSRNFLVSFFIHRGESFYGQRIFGYIAPLTTGSYRFSLIAGDFAEVWLSSDTSPFNSMLILSYNPFLGMQLASDYQSLSLNSWYYIEIIHVQTRSIDLILLEWLIPGDSEFSFIPPDCFMTLSIYHDITYYTTTVYPMHSIMNDSLLPSDARTSSYTIPIYPDKSYRNYFSQCDIMNLTFSPRPVVQHNGLYELQYAKIFPHDTSHLYRFIYPSDPAMPIFGNLKLSSHHANDILSNFLLQIDSFLTQRDLTYFKLLNIEEKSHLDHVKYLIEISVKHVTFNTIYRIVDYFFLKNYSSNQFCHAPLYVPSQSQVFVHFVVVVYNLAQAVMEFIHQLERIQRDTGDTRFGLIIVDFSSTDLDIPLFLENCDLQHYKYISMIRRFSKSQGQNVALESVSNHGDIVFLCDLHLLLPSNILGEIRMHTIIGTSAYAPIMFRLNCGHSHLDPIGFWDVWDVGMISMFKTDWMLLGGKDFVKYPGLLRGEDSDLLDRAVALGYNIERKAHINLFHCYHKSIEL